MPWRWQFLLAATDADKRAAVHQMLPWILLVLVVIFAGTLVIFLLKKWMDKSEETPPDSGFSLSHMRTLHKRGEITDEQYEKIRAKIVAAAERQFGPKAPAPPVPKPPSPDPQATLEAELEAARRKAAQMRETQQRADQAEDLPPLEEDPGPPPEAGGL